MLLTSPLSSPLKNPVRDVFSPAGGSPSLTAQMPTASALGIWYMDQYVTTPRARVPNAAITGVTPTNLLAAPRRLFNHVALNFYTPRSSFADSGLSAPDGTNDASLLTGVGNFAAGPTNQITFGATDYTLAIRARRSGGTDQNFKMQFTSVPVSTSATKTATASWQWFTHTSTRTASTQSVAHVISFDGATGANIETTDWMVLTGIVTSDAALDAAASAQLQGDIYFLNHTYASGAVDISTPGSVGLVQFPVTKTLSKGTAIALVSKVATGSTYQSFMGKAQDYTNFSAMADESGGSNAYFGTASLGTTARPIALLNQGYHMLAIRYDDAVLSYWIDDFKTDEKVVSTGNATIQDLFLGLINAGSLYAGIKLAGIMALYDRDLTDAEMRTVYNLQKARSALSGITITRARFLVAFGDSITEATTGYFYRFLPNSSPVSQGRNYAVSGADLDGVTARITTFLANAPEDLTGFVSLIFVGANLPIGYSITDFLTAYAVQCDRLRARGVKLALCTILPRVSDVSDSFNTRRATINTELRLWTTSGSTAPGKHADAIIDFAADPNMGIDAAANGVATWDGTYYTDGVHPTATGHTRLETIARPVINAL